MSAPEKNSKSKHLFFSTVFPEELQNFCVHPPKASSDQEEEAVRKGLGDIMGGKVLELESERLKAEGRTEGEAIGQARGETRLGSLITRLIQEQRTEEIPIVSTDATRREQLYKEYNL